MAVARRHRLDIVLVWKLDRLGRSLRHLVNTLAEFEALGIALVVSIEPVQLELEQSGPLAVASAFREI